MSSRRKLNLTVSIVGAGRLGTALGAALAKRGYSINAVVARTLKHARAASRRISSAPVPIIASRLNELPTSDLLLIATPDDAIEETAAVLASATSVPHKRIALHTSGALSSKALAPLAGVGYGVGSWHPLVSVPEAATADFQGIYVCLEGSPMAIQVGRRLARDLGARSFSIKTDEKPLYHAAAVTSAGHVVALFDIALEMLKRCGLTESQAQKVLIPLIRSTVGSLTERSPSQALTGTFSRGDVLTVRRHLAAIKDSELSDALDAYRLLGKRSLSLARAHSSGAAKNFEEIARILLETEKKK